MSTHTPGPWFATSQDDYPTGEVSADPLGVRHIVSTYGDNAKADARLIAAAPDLLEALRDCVAALGGIRSDAVPESARAAITKATKVEA